MRRELSTRFLAVVAVTLAIFSAVFCQRWTVRCAGEIRKHENQVASMRVRQEMLEDLLLNMAALMRSARDNPEELRKCMSRDLLPPVADPLPGFPRLQSFELARAELFLKWYECQMRERHLTREQNAAPAPHEVPATETGSD